MSLVPSLLMPVAFQRPGWQPPSSVSAIISDIDGTLFPFGGCEELSAHDCTALCDAFDAGIHVCLATGRIPGPWLDKITAQLEPRVLRGGVYANGALVVGDGDRVIRESLLPAAAITAVEEHTRGARVACGGGRISVLACTRVEGEPLGYLELAPDGSTWVSTMIDGAGEPNRPVTDFAALHDARVLKFVLFSAYDVSKLPAYVQGAVDTNAEPPWAPMGPTVAALREQLKGTGATVLDCGPNQCEVLPECVHKGDGVAQLLAHIGVEPTAALACGDAENDVEMLRLVGTGVAMTNAKPAAMEACDCVHDSVAEAVERYALGRGEGTGA